MREQVQNSSKEVERESNPNNRSLTMNRSMLSKAIVSAIATLGLTLSSAMAATYTWDGGSTTDDYWNTADNWDANGIPGNDTDDETYINNGGTAVIAADAVSYDLYLAYTTVDSGYIEHNAGTLAVTNKFSIRQGNGGYTLNGGRFEIGSFFIGEFLPEWPTTQSFIQNDGEFYNAGGMSINNNKLVEIRGGTFEQTDTLNVRNGTFRIVGSAATIKVGIDGTGYGFRGGDNSADAVHEFVLDNSAAHISTVEMDANQNRRSGVLQVSLHGGVLLSGQDTFKLTHTSGSYNTIHQGWGDAGDLWTVNLNQADAEAGGRMDTVTLATAAAATEDTLDASIGGNSVSFAATTTGYIDLTGLTGDETSLKLNLLWDAENSTADVADFTALLDDAGITNWLIAADQIGIELNPFVSGASYFAWDLAGIGSDGALKGITVIPEPATGFLVLLGGSLALMRRRRKGE